jgi:SAM-dependent methyltransferase
MLRAYHREQLPDAALDEALGLPESVWIPSAAHGRLQAKYPGESIVNLATPYAVCRGLFCALDLGEDDCFVDLGCGDGRVLIYGAAVTPARFRGIELVAERARGALERVRKLQLERVTVVQADVLDQDFGEGDVFYAHRPFSVETEAEVIARLHAEARRRPIRVATHRLQPSLFDATLFDRELYGALVVYRSV